MNKLPVRVLHCIETIGSGGVEQRRLSLARYLDKQKFEQRLVCSYVLADFNQKFEALGVHVSSIRGLLNLFNVGYYRRLIREVKAFRPDIIHGAVFEGVVSAIVGGLWCKVPLIIVEETSDPQNRSWRGNLLMRILCSRADLVVGISPSVVSYLLDTVKVPQKKLRLIYNGVEIPANASKDTALEIRSSLGLQENDFVVGSVGRLRDFHKRFSDLIKAVVILRSQIPQLKLLIIGDGQDLSMLRGLADELGVSDRVIFAGFQKDPGPYYGVMNVFALASHMEGFGLVAVEAMFSKLPVVATAVGGLEDVVEQGVTGILVKRHSPQQLASAIFRIYEDPGLGKSMGERGYQRALQKFSAIEYARNVECLYLEALSRS